MRPKMVAVAGVLLLMSTAGLAQQNAPGAAPFAALPEIRTLTLQEALALAEASNPALRSKQGERAAAEGFQKDAAALLNSNPNVSLEQTRRVVPRPDFGTERFWEWRAGISQTLEIAGQRGYRRNFADASMAALRYEIANSRRQIRAEVAERFYRVLALQQRTELEGQALKLFEETAAAVQKRRSAGEDTRLDANVATVEAERARNQLALAQEQLLEARNDLAAKLQLPPTDSLQAVGDLTVLRGSYSLRELLSAVDAQPRMRALAEREDSARAKLDLERASAYPDITVGVDVAREGPGGVHERLTTLFASVPLPLFKRNAAGIGRAISDLTQVQIDRQTSRRDARASVEMFWSKLNSLEARVRRLQEVVLPALDDNRTLSVKSQRAGQIGLLELIVVNRQALDARRDLIDALADYQTTRLALELAAGWPLEETRQ